jgi:hypothetical protein
MVTATARSDFWDDWGKAARQQSSTHDIKRASSFKELLQKERNVGTGN